MTRARNNARHEFNDSSYGDLSFISDGHRQIFMALTSGQPNFCLTSVFVNGKPGVAIVMIDADHQKKLIQMMPCFVATMPGMTLRLPGGEEFDMFEEEVAND